MVQAVVKKAMLPKQQLIILAICRFAEPVAVTSVNPYIVRSSNEIQQENICVRVSSTFTDIYNCLVFDIARDDPVVRDSDRSSGEILGLAVGLLLALTVPAGHSMGACL